MRERTKNDAVINYLAELPADVMQALQKSEVYQRFVFEQAQLTKLVEQSLAETGKLNSAEALAQDKIVQKLGGEVLKKIKEIEFLRDEPSAEEVRALTGNRK